VKREGGKVVELLERGEGGKGMRLLVAPQTLIRAVVARKVLRRREGRAKKSV